MRIPSQLLLGFCLLLSACTSSGAAPSTPADFALRYEWFEGSLPPPYHYEYTISLAADGSGQIEMVPNYPGPDVPVWTDSFKVTPAQRDALYKLMLDQGLLRTSWSEDPMPPVGGSHAALSVTADGREVQIPSFVPSGQQAAQASIYAAVEELVPQEIRDSLEAQRKEYVAQKGG